MDQGEKATSESFLAVDHLKVVLVSASLDHNATKNGHFILFKSSDIFCIVTATCGQLNSFTDPSLSYQEPLGCYLLTPFHLNDKRSAHCEGSVKQRFRTVHD